jgi:hypothetical protein
VSAAATRDDLAAVVTALSEQAATQRRWEAEYETSAATSRASAASTTDQLEYERHRSVQHLNEKFAAQARGTATAYEVSADMIRKYVTVPE